MLLPLGTSLVVAELRTMKTVIESWEKHLTVSGFPHIDDKTFGPDQLRETLVNFCGEMLLMSDKAHSLATRIALDADDL